MPAASPVRALARRLERWPSRCALCLGWGRGRLCKPCLTLHAPAASRCRHCALTVPGDADTCAACLFDPPAFMRAVAAVDYVAPWSGLIRRWKFHDGHDASRAFAALLRTAVERSGLEADLLLPMPLSRARLAERGANQAWEIARRLASDLGRPADARTLRRLVDTAPIAHLGRAERRQAVRGVFDVEPSRRASLAGRNVALVDDVLTTGATAHEAAQVLLDAGAASVQVWVLARTPAPAKRPA